MLIAAAKACFYQWDEATVCYLAEFEFRLDLVGTFAEKLLVFLMFLLECDEMEALRLIEKRWLDQEEDCAYDDIIEDDEAEELGQFNTTEDEKKHFEESKKIVKTKAAQRDCLKKFVVAKLKSYLPSDGGAGGSVPLVHPYLPPDDDDYSREIFESFLPPGCKAWKDM